MKTIEEILDRLTEWRIYLEKVEERIRDDKNGDFYEYNHFELAESRAVVEELEWVLGGSLEYNHVKKT